ERLLESADRRVAAGCVALQFAGPLGGAVGVDVFEEGVETAQPEAAVGVCRAVELMDLLQVGLSRTATVVADAVEDTDGAGMCDAGRWVGQFETARQVCGEVVRPRAVAARNPVRRDARPIDAPPTEEVCGQSRLLIRTGSQERVGGQSLQGE